MLHAAAISSSTHAMPCTHLHAWMQQYHNTQEDEKAKEGQ